MQNLNIVNLDNIIVVGAEGSGKSSFINYYAHGDHSKHTLDEEFARKTSQSGNTQYIIRIFEIPFHNIFNCDNLKSPDVVICLFALNNRETFTEIESLIEDILPRLEGKVPIAVVGTH